MGNATNIQPIDFEFVIKSNEVSSEAQFYATSKEALMPEDKVRIQHGQEILWGGTILVLIALFSLAKLTKKLSNVGRKNSSIQDDSLQSVSSHVYPTNQEAIQQPPLLPIQTDQQPLSKGQSVQTDSSISHPDSRYMPKS